MERQKTQKKRILSVPTIVGQNNLDPKCDKVSPVTMQNVPTNISVVSLVEDVIKHQLSSREAVKRRKVGAEMRRSEDDPVSNIGIEPRTDQQEKEEDLEIIDEVIKMPYISSATQSSQSTPPPPAAVETEPFTASASSREVEVFIKVCDSQTGSVLVNPVRFPSRMNHLASFMKRHDYVLQLNGTGGYSVVCKEPSSDSRFPIAPNMARPNFLRPPILATRHDGGSTIYLRKVRTSPLYTAQQEAYPAVAFGEMISSTAPDQGPKTSKNPQNDLLAAMGLTLKKQSTSTPCTITKADEGESTSSTPSSSQNDTNSSEASTRDVQRDCSTPSMEKRRTLRSSRKSKETEAPVNVAELEKRETLWGCIAPVDLVFVRWEDDWFYSGTVKSPGKLSNSWEITFDDGVEYTAFTSDILPIRILGMGTSVNYPANSVRPRDAVVIGQKIELNPATKSFSVKYALQLQGKKEPIWATRSELCFTESSVMTLQIQYELAQQAGAEVDKQGSSDGRKVRRRYK